MTRVKLVELTESHLDEIFPYETIHLAGALAAIADERSKELIKALGIE